jgi:DNA mismatch repair protein MutS
MAQIIPENQKNHQRRESLTPLMQQYQDIRARYPGMILFFRLGDFYEMFGEDAQKASRILEVVLTQRQGIPMCGVPHHAINAYLKKLIKAGEKVAICEQLEDPAAARGIVKRDVVRVITPGTILEENLLEAKQNNYLLALFPADRLDRFGLAFVDISTGEFGATELAADKLEHELFRLAPGEIVVPSSCEDRRFIASFEQRAGVTASTLEDWLFSFQEAETRICGAFGVQSLKPFGLEGHPLAAAACGGILAYLEKTQIGQMPALGNIRCYSLDDYLILDDIAIRNLELMEGLSSHSKENSLLEAIDLTLTPMGARLLRQWLLRPLLSVEKITERQQAVGHFVDEGLVRRGIRDLLKAVADLERILSRVASGAAGPRELAALKASLALIPQLRQLMSGSDGSIVTPPAGIAALAARLLPPGEVVQTINAAIQDEPPATLKEGGVIRPGFNAELDELRTISRDAKTLISQMEAKERQRTGISTLKIAYTSVFGYFLEITKANLHNVPPEYIRKQTLANGERFITAELKAFEEKILSADEKILRLELELFRQTLAKILEQAKPVQELSAAIAELDVFCSFAEVAVNGNYRRPQVDDSFVLSLKDGRHPVIERKIKSGTFVANDTFLDGEGDQLVLLTGPNMAGKSTYLRQVALIVVLAQMGSFVPCAEARIGIIDRIFTRIGAGDNLAAGESTFMVEMHETSNILNQFTSRSLIILDEVGRGTSTYDGISIAWAAVEFLARKKDGAVGPKVLFATHYFELTDLEGKLPGVKNSNVAVKEWQGDVVFLHKIVPGAADRSYGIHVAQLAGLPKDLVQRAHEILFALERKAPSTPAQTPADQLDFFASPQPEILIELDSLNVNAMTPLEALGLLAKWKEKYRP